MYERRIEFADFRLAFGIYSIFVINLINVNVLETISVINGVLRDGTVETGRKTWLLFREQYCRIVVSQHRLDELLLLKSSTLRDTDKILFTFYDVGPSRVARIAFK